MNKKPWNIVAFMVFALAAAQYCRCSEEEDETLVPNSIENVNEMHVNVDKKTDKTKLNWQPTKNVEYKHNIMSLTQVMFGKHQPKQARVDRDPVREEVNIYNKVLEIYRRAATESPPGKYFNQLGNILLQLNPKYISTVRIYEIVNADTDQLWAEAQEQQRQAAMAFNAYATARAA